MTATPVARVADALEALRRRPESLLVGAFVAGLLAGPRSAGLVVVACALVLALGGWRRGVLALGLVAAVLAGAVVADARLAALERPAAGVREGAPVASDATLLQAPRRWAGGFRVAIARLGSLRVLVRAPPGVRWPGGAPGAGDVVRVRGTLHRLRPRDAWLRARSVHAVLAPSSIAATGRRRGGFARRVDDLRRRAEQVLTAGLPAGPAALLRGMALGQDEALPDDVRDDFRASGLAHLVAASGQNVMLLAALVLACCAVAGVGLRARMLLVLAAIALYVPLAGGGPSIQRAGVMGAAGVVALLAGRPALRWHALLLAGAVTLTLSPRAAEDPGWQLSFAAVLGILVFGPRLRARLAARNVPAGLAEAVAVTVAATLATAPLMSAQFGTTSLVALPANVLAAPAVAPAMWLGMAAAALGQVAPGAASVPAALAMFPVAFLEALAHAAARMPHAQIAAPTVAVAVACALAAALAAGPAGRRARALVLGAAALAATAGGVAVLRHRPPPPPAGARVSVLDIGQGDATLLQFGRHAVLVDTGPPGGPVLARLRDAGVDRLDALLVTHAQDDHLGAAAQILAALPVGALFDGRDGVREAWGARMAAEAARHDVRRWAPAAGDVIRAGPITLRVLWPPADGGAGATVRTGGDPNDRAVVARADVGGLSVLLTADAESDVLAGLDLGHVDVLKVAHHGSADLGLPAILTRVRPRVAVVSVGEHNRYGHPVPATLRALAAAGADVYRTDRQGTIRIEPAAGASLRIHAGQTSDRRVAGGT